MRSWRGRVPARARARPASSRSPCGSDPARAQHALAALAGPPLFLRARQLAPIERGAVGLRQLGAVVAVVRRARLLVRQDLARAREPLEPLGEQRAEPPRLLAVPGVGMEPLRLLQIRAPDGPAVGVGGDPEQLVVRQPISPGLELLELVLHVGRKLDGSSGAARRRTQTVSPCACIRARVAPEYPTVQSGEKDLARPLPAPR